MWKFIMALAFLLDEGCQDAALAKYRCKPLDETALDHKAPAGQNASDEPRTVRVQMDLRDREEIAQRIASASDSKSRFFRAHLTPREMDAHYPAIDDLVATRERLEAQGVTVLPGHADGLRAHGKPRDLERAARKAGGIVAMHGVTPLSPRVNHAATADDALGMLTPARLRSAYGVPVAADAEGQTVGILALDGYKREDIEAFARVNGIPMPVLTDVHVGDCRGKIQTASGQIETTMDIQILMSMRPKEIVVFLADNHGTGFLDALHRIARPPRGQSLVRIVSCSWGTPEVAMSPAELRAQEDLLMTMAAQGQTLVVAAGDSGAKDDQRHIGVDSPASSPHALAVGGTSLELNAQGQWERETVWWRAGLAGEPDSGTGGGISCVFDVPSWQVQTVSRSQGAKDRARRNLPDVSLAADPGAPGYAVIVNGKGMAVGGTSCSAPAVAGILAIAETARAHAGKPPIGFFPPDIYAIGAVAPGAFHDIADGNTNGLYSALPGYDDATGFGSFDVSRFVEEIVRR